MTDPLREKLQAALGGAYTIERELGGGGMARVYVAEETAFGRHVVVKLLSPELAAGVNVDRFKREILLAAKLQHPHIVPLITAGEIDGLPWYTMPFVEGESLRDRLGRGPLDVSDSVAILRDVARALDYAHAAGVVHRDIKPENILLPRGSASVADFGIAKALSLSKTEESNATLTQIGLSIGTPMYMAPEQAAGDPAVDHRADIYAFGCVAYELLGGQPPFAAATPQRMIAAHMNETPQRLTALRPQVPPALAALIMRCLAKDPYARPQTAGELIAALDSAPPERRVPSVPQWVAIAAAALLVIGTGAIAMRTLGLGPFASLLAAGTLERDRPLMVSEFTVNNSTDTTLGKVIAEAVRADLSQSRAFDLLPAADAQRVLIEMQRPNARLLLPVAREVALRRGAKAVVDGTLQPLGAGYVVTLRVVTADSARELASFTDAADSPSQLIRVVGGLTRKLREKIGESLKNVQASPPLWQVTTSSLAALQKYTEARQAINANRRAEYDRLLKEAIAIDSNFAAAYISLASNRLNEGSHLDEAARYLAKVHSLRDRLSDRDRWSGESFFYTFGPVDTRDTAKSRTFEDSLQMRFTSGPFGALANNRKATRFRLGGDFARAESTFRIAAQLDPAASYPIFNLIDAQLDAGHLAAAESTIESVKGRFAPPVIDRWKWTVGASAGFLAQAESGSLARFAKVQTPRRRAEEATDLAILAAQQGRIKDARRYAGIIVDAENEQGNPTRAIAAAVNAAETIIWTTADSAAAVAAIDSALKRNPLDSLADLDRPYDLLAPAFAMMGQLPRARLYLDGLVRQRVEGQARVAWTIPMTRARIAMAEKRWDDAVRIVSVPIESLCRSCIMLARAMAHDGRGDADSAVVWYERYMHPLKLRGAALAPIQRRLAELYETKGDVEHALTWYAKFLETWTHADPELRPQIDDVTRRVARLHARQAARR